MTSVQNKGLPSLRVLADLDDFKLPNPSNMNNSHPRRFRNFLWDADALDSYVTPSADLTETLPPLPSPPASAHADREAVRTWYNNAYLFKIVTPVRVDTLEYELRDHPNRPLVNSVLKGFREGFWPFAEQPADFPCTWDEPSKQLSSENEQWMRNYVKEEQQVGRYSASIGTQLLPGMYSMPSYVIPKPHSEKKRLINDHSAGKYSLNAMIDSAQLGMRPDTVGDLAHNLLKIRRDRDNIPLQIFKSDVASAYRLLPMHPLWQLKQVVTVNGQRYIDRCMTFGNRGSPDLWITFFSLVLWIAKRKKIERILAYMDDVFSDDPSPANVWYPKHSVYMPPRQAALLKLWDSLGIPHDAPKQLAGQTLTVTGILVDPASMTLKLPDETRLNLVKEIQDFLNTSTGHRLRKWHRLLGHINWGLEVKPLLRPALLSSTAKIAGMTDLSAHVPLNRRIRRDLQWVANHFARSDSGVQILNNLVWGPKDADMLIYCDACLEGMAFWVPAKKVGFVSKCPKPPKLVENSGIFWFEALTVLSALEWAARQGPKPGRLAILTDNMNTVHIFDSLRGQPGYDELLLCACSTLIESGIDLRVWHVSGEQNTVADALSRSKKVDWIYLQVRTFVPPSGRFTEDLA